MSLLVDFHETHAFSELFFRSNWGVSFCGVPWKNKEKNTIRKFRPILVNCWWNVIGTPTLGGKNESDSKTSIESFECRCIVIGVSESKELLKSNLKDGKKSLQKHHLLTNLQYIHFQEAKFAKCFVEPLGKSEMVC